MNLVFQVNLIIAMLFIIICGLGVINTLDDIRLRVDHELSVSTEVAHYVIEAQMARLEMEVKEQNIPPSEWASRFHLEDLYELLHVDIELIAANGELLDANHSAARMTATNLPGWFENALKAYLGHTETIITPIDLAGQHLGDIVIRPSFTAEWNDIRSYIKKTMMPLILTFLIGSLIIALIASLVLRPVAEMLSGKIKTKPPSRSRFTFFRLNQLVAVNQQLRLLKQRYLDTDQKIEVLNQQLITIQETERKRLSAELHDEIGQHLTAIRFDLNAIRNSASLAEAKTSAAMIDSVHHRMTGIVRSMLQRLRPPELAELGLHGAVTALVNDWSLHYPGHHVALAIEGHCNHLNEIEQLTVYRILQECLTNIGRHAGTANIKVNILLRCSDNEIYMRVGDDGKGFDVSKTSNGYGLTGMKERVEALGGRFDVQTTPDEGVTVSAIFHTEGIVE